MTAVTKRHRPRRLLALSVVALSVTLAFESAAFTAAGSASSVKTVRLQNVALHPAKLAVPRGTTVRWVWLDARLATSHNVTSRPGGSRFKSSHTMLSGSFSVRFSKPGRYFYECTIHPASMQGEITVS